MRNGETDSLLDWANRAVIRIAANPDEPFTKELHKKLAMLNLMIVGKEGGVSQLGYDVIPNLLYTLIHSSAQIKCRSQIFQRIKEGYRQFLTKLSEEKPRNPSLAESSDDPFAVRLNLVLTRIMIPMLLNDMKGLREGTDAILLAGASPKWSVAQNSIYEETVGSLLLSSNDPKWFSEGRSIGKISKYA